MSILRLECYQKQVLLVVLGSGYNPHSSFVVVVSIPASTKKHNFGGLVFYYLKKRKKQGALPANIWDVKLKISNSSKNA